MPRILLCAEAPAVVEDVRELLAQAGHGITWQSLDAEVPDLAGVDLVVLHRCQYGERGLRFCRRVRARVFDHFVPILFVTDDHSPTARQAALECGADAYLLRPFTPAELLAQVQAFLRLRGLNDRLSEKSAEVHRVNQRLQQAYRQLDQEMELARRIQRSFLPRKLPHVPPVRFAVSYRPCGRVGGDFYDVFRLDEHHVGFYVADAMGHGLPASLLTIFVKKGVRAKEIYGREYRLLPPDEVLRALNRDLIDQALAELPFITMVYALFDCRDRTLAFSRAGHPYPLYVPRQGEPRLWQVEGSLLGIFDTPFPVQKHSLRPGDKVLLYTDGLEPPSAEVSGTGTDLLFAAAARHRELPVEAFVERLSTDLLRDGSQPDDFTLLGLEVRE
jgi:sigma-B regulation protein RsbU (phosphoserine phosphatase)